jgi:glycosyltransferase involved in cell wall biosynthesis
MNSGGRLRSLNMLSELARYHEVSVLSTHSRNEDGDALRQQLPQCKRVISLPFEAPKWRNPRFPLVLMRSWLSPLPVDMWKHRVPKLRQTIEELMQSGEIDLCVADFLVTTPNVPMNQGIPVVFFAHNVDHVMWKRLCRASSLAWMRPVLEIEWRKVRRYESKVCRQAALTVAVSPQDRKALEESAPTAVIRAIPTGVDIDYFKPNGASEKPASLVFTGSMDYYPNEDAIRYFMNDVLPIVRREFPHIDVTVVGRDPSQSLREAAKTSGVELTGRVPDVRPYMNEASVYIAPIRVGGGTRLKIYEALAMGKPVVSTTIGAEGLPLTDGEHFLCADKPDTFATAIISLLLDKNRCRELGMAGQSLVREQFAWPVVTRKFTDLCSTAQHSDSFD